MGCPLSDEPSGSKSSKRKGTRSVSTLTPSQLSRKRANDREAQRAIRARTKERIECLERELEKLRSHQSRDRTLQGLLRRNKALEDELSRLRESMSMTMAAPSYSAGDGEQLTPHAVAVPSSRMSLLTAFDNRLPDYGQHYVAISGSSVDSWAANVPSHMGFNVSSPSSSANDYSSYIPTGVPTSHDAHLHDAHLRQPEFLDDFCMNSMQRQGVSPSVYIQHQQSQQPSQQGSFPATGKCTRSTATLSCPRVARPASPNRPPPHAIASMMRKESEWRMIGGKLSPTQGNSLSNEGWQRHSASLLWEPSPTTLHAKHSLTL
ncbi:hypothetical protein CRV24_008660 [Beauveria bassiana]|nr:hypothetical protein CRV24_008660 [Beauveria bassiana]KAH8715391.1 hypothetical protein HC256_004217 [Beauveria bassiana]